MGHVHLLRNWVPPLAWMAVIFWGSSAPDLRATPVALLVLDHLAVLPGLEAISPFLGTLLSSPGAELVLRKTAHITEFAILAYLVTKALSTQHPRHTGHDRNPVPLAGVLSLAYAVADELHQHFVPGRSCRPEDILIDAVGISLGLILARKVFRKRGSILRH